jgi:hypothetical protein
LKQVTDHRSNPNEQVETAVRAIGRSKDRRKIFEAVYKGKKRIKKVSELEKITGLGKVRVLQEAGKLAGNGIIHQTKIDKETAYEKDTFFSTNKAKILRFVDDPKKLVKLPTKTRPTLTIKNNVTVNLPKSFVRAQHITVDDIDSFSQVRKVKLDAERPFTKMLEADFKNGVKRIISTRSSFKDWGGEKNDLLTTNLKYKRKRISTAFAFKGRGKSGKLTPAKMGKNGDQIQRLFQSPADLFIVQYWGEIDQSVVEQVQSFAQLRSVHLAKTVYFCLIDGDDSNRIIDAYPDKF